MSGHTPGPWKYGSYFIEGAGETVVCACADSGMKVADARLIHAAPDMLAALQGLIEALGPEGYFPAAGKSRTDAARAAIAKATGKPKP